MSTRFVAREDIPWGGVLAYTRGQTIEADAVKDNGWEDRVVGENTKEAREIKAEITGRPISDFEPGNSPATPARRAPATEKQEG